MHRNRGSEGENWKPHLICEPLGEGDRVEGGEVGALTIKTWGFGVAMLEISLSRRCRTL